MPACTSPAPASLSPPAPATERGLQAYLRIRAFAYLQNYISQQFQRCYDELRPSSKGERTSAKYFVEHIGYVLIGGNVILADVLVIGVRATGVWFGSFRFAKHSVQHIFDFFVLCDFPVGDLTLCQISQQVTIAAIAALLNGDSLHDVPLLRSFLPAVQPETDHGNVELAGLQHILRDVERLIGKLHRDGLGTSAAREDDDLVQFIPRAVKFERGLHNVYAACDKLAFQVMGNFLVIDRENNQHCIHLFSYVISERISNVLSL
nr:MAG TPA: hypothetical protein [Caudoviricetes sp.]